MFDGFIEFVWECRVIHSLKKLDVRQAMDFLPNVYGALVDNRIEMTRQ